MEFEDREQLLSSLQSLPSEARVSIAVRASLRVLVLATKSWRTGIPNERQIKLTLIILRCLITSSVWSHRAAIDLDYAITNSRTSVELHKKKFSGFGGKKRSGAVASSAAQILNSIDAQLMGMKAAQGFDSRLATAIWTTLDCTDYPEVLVGQIVLDMSSELESRFGLRLWEYPSDFFVVSEQRTGREDILEDLGAFAFWRRWYEGFVFGAPLDWDLQRRVALIPQEVWDAGAGAVAEAIAEIEAEYLQEKAPLAERVEFNEENCRFRVVPIPMANAAFMSALMSRTADALDDALHGNNGLREDMREVRVLRRTHERYSNDPQRVEMDYTSVAISLRRNLDAKELADSDDNLALLEAVEDGVRGLRAHHPDVAANRETLAKQAMRELPADQIALLKDAQDVLPEITEGVMQEDFARDIPKLINDATLPLPSGAPPLPGADEATRIFSRSAGIKLLYEKTRNTGAAAFDSKDVKTVRLGLTVWSLLKELVSLGLKLFGVF